jgi:ectoine hydroxylase-related dioxygenase (phytanoyl-CoA dioxygenase family)
MASLDPARLQTFESVGAVLMPGLLDVEWIGALRDAMPEIVATAYDPTERMGGGGSKRVVQRDGMWRDNETFARFLFGSPVGGTAAAFMRSGTARLYEDLLIYAEPAAKDPAIRDHASWHRDAPYWPLRGTQLASVWFSLEAVTADTGAMRFVVGSHLDPDELVTHSATDDELEGREKVTIEAEPGDAVVFHPRVLHMAYGSAPDRPRRTFTLRFTGDDVRWRPRREMFHPWMAECGLEKGAPLDHPWFPVVARLADREPALT